MVTALSVGDKTVTKTLYSNSLLSGGLHRWEPSVYFLSLQAFEVEQTSWPGAGVGRKLFREHVRGGQQSRPGVQWRQSSPAGASDPERMVEKIPVNK